MRKRKQIQKEMRQTYDEQARQKRNHILLDKEAHLELGKKMVEKDIQEYTIKEFKETKIKQ